MSGFGSGSLKHSNYETKEYVSVWDGAGAASLDDASFHSGVVSVAYTATGKYTITMADWPGQLIDVELKNHRASGSAPLVGSPVWASVDKAAKTIPIEVWDMATPSLTNCVDDTTVVLKVTFKKTV